MLWSLTKVLIFIALAAALTYAASFIIETPGEVRIAFGTREISLSPIGFLVVLLVGLLAVWILLKIVALVIAVLRFLWGDETAISRYFDRNRERKGFDALTDGMIALASGESRLAQVKASRAEKLLNRPELTRLLNAQAAELSGNTDRATQYYKQMLTDDRSRFVGVRGLLQQKLKEGDTETALKLAEKAFALRPKHHDVLDKLFELQSDKADWTGARTTLQAKIRAGALPRDVGKRRDAVLSLADARIAIEDGNETRARDAAIQANKLAPGFAPAAALAAEQKIRSGDKRGATSILRKAWNAAPQPDLAAAFAAIEPDETPEARLKRFQTLIKSNPAHAESKMVLAELMLAAEDFPAARRALGDLAETDPTARSLAIMAAVAKGEGAPDHEVKAWLAKAIGAPRGEAWTCENCNHVHAHWLPTCENCKAFDTLEWTMPPQTPEMLASSAAMLPLIVGALEAASEEPQDDPVEADAEDAEIAEDIDDRRAGAA